MTRLILSFLCLTLSLTGFSQKVYFVYLQTETDQPFYVRMDKITFSSSSSGYLILPKLKDSTYSFAVGFPEGKWPEQRFSVTMNKKDHGYLVKNFGDKGWGLFDLHTLSVQMANAGSAWIPGANKDESPFTDILSKASDDPSLKEIAVAPVNEKGTGTAVVKEEKTQEPAEVKQTETDTVKNEVTKTKESSKQKKGKVQKQDPNTEPVIAKVDQVKTEAIIPAKNTETVLEPVSQEPKTKKEETVVAKTEEKKPVEPNIYKSSTVIKRSENNTKDGVGIVYIDQHGNGNTDTISVVIPNPQPIVSPKGEVIREDKKFIEMVPDASKSIEEKQTAETKSFYREMNNCPSIARDNDFFKLRKQMASVNGDEKMIVEAGKYFKEKCFSTQQIKNLGTLFLTDAGKYNFYVEGYYHVSDKNNYTLLLPELKDEQYISLFKAMVGK